MDAFTAHSSCRAQEWPAIAVFCRQCARGDIGQQHAMAWRLRQKARSSFPADSTGPLRWARMTPAKGWFDSWTKPRKILDLQGCRPIRSSTAPNWKTYTAACNLRCTVPSPVQMLWPLPWKPPNVWLPKPTQNRLRTTRPRNSSDSSTFVCSVCGYRNRRGMKFCGMCGGAVNQSGALEFSASAEPERALSRPRNAFPEQEPDGRPTASRTSAQETHHYHHHYHHHYFPGGQESTAARSADDAAAQSKSATCGRPRPSGAT